MVCLVLLVGCGWNGCGGNPAQTTGVPPIPDPIDFEKLRPQVVAFCAACHEMPRPDRFPKDAWAQEVDQGFDFYYKLDALARKAIPKPPAKRLVREFFRQQAPDHLQFEKTESSPSKIEFAKTQVVIPGKTGGANPGVANLAWLRRRGDPSAMSLYVSDMGTSIHQEIQFADATAKLKARQSVGFPCHTCVTDLFVKGEFGCVVADLGSLLPEDHARGRVMWVDRGSRMHVLAKGVGRVTDVQVADFDGDGDQDLVAAVFGWRTTGKIILLRRKNQPNLAPEEAFQVEQIDPRHGCIHVPVVDINEDGKPDFVALLSQEHESIVAFVNDGRGKFKARPLYKADSPSFGSSGIQMVDMNGDKRVDVLYSNGDTYDSFHLKPYHGIRWIENRGKQPWKEHFVAIMPGVHRALASDLDGDGDLDIAACALIPIKMLVDGTSRRLDSLIWLEQVKGGQYKRHVLERDSPRHATMEVADFDADGDPDLAVGYHAGQGDKTQTSVTIWWNQRIKTTTGQ